MSWESPIEIIVNQIESAWDDEIFRVIQKVDINVDRNELIKALQYDWNQYEKGYEDGINDSKIIRCKDCQWWDVDYRECNSPNWYPDPSGCVLQPAGMYCGHGERRTDNGD